MNAFSAMASDGRDSKVVWKSAIRFWVSNRMRLRPCTAYCRGEGGRTELDEKAS